MCVDWELFDGDDSLRTTTTTTVCINGLCRYKFDTETSPCQRNGIPISHFYLGRNFISCVCPDNFIGRRCEIPNEMNPSKTNKTFNLE